MATKARSHTLKTNFSIWKNPSLVCTFSLRDIRAFMTKHRARGLQPEAENRWRRGTRLRWSPHRVTDAVDHGAQEATSIQVTFKSADRNGHSLLQSPPSLQKGFIHHNRLYDPRDEVSSSPTPAPCVAEPRNGWDFWSEEAAAVRVALNSGPAGHGDRSFCSTGFLLRHRKKIPVLI